MGPFKRTQDGNEYIAMMQGHFTKCVEGRVICGKEALTVANAIVQEWILKMVLWFHITVIGAKD